MCRLIWFLRLRVRHTLRHPDRGEFGPMAYTVMVSAMVLLALAVAAWGQDLADTFMTNTPEELPDGGDGDGDGD